MKLFQLISGVVLLLAALAFTFIFPGSGLEETIITGASALFGALGIKKFRENYDLAKGWMKSKTIVGVLIVVVTVIVLALQGYFGWVFPEYVTYVLTGLITIGAGTLLKGLIDSPKQGEAVK
jgi:multisubunit Na+/H+ antiporter MnhG subunit